MMAEQTLIDTSGSGSPQRAWALALEGSTADISDVTPSAITKLRMTYVVSGFSRTVSTGAHMSNGTPNAPTTERRMIAWIGKAVRVEGKVISEEDLTIDGDVQGSIELGGHSLTIGQDARIKADLLAKTVTISGKVSGNVRAIEKV